MWAKPAACGPHAHFPRPPRAPCVSRATPVCPVQAPACPQGGHDGPGGNHQLPCPSHPSGRPLHEPPHCKLDAVSAVRPCLAHFPGEQGRRAGGERGGGTQAVPVPIRLP